MLKILRYVLIPEIYIFGTFGPLAAGYEETNNIFTSFDVSCDDRLVCAGTEAKKEETHLIFWWVNVEGTGKSYVDSLMQKKSNSSALALITCKSYVAGQLDGWSSKS